MNIEIFKTGERSLDPATDGSFQFGALADIGGVEVCVAERRDAFASFEPFARIDMPNCELSVPGESVTLRGVPADSDLILTVTKSGYEPETLTFRTDDFDVGAPTGAADLAIELARAGATERWLEPEPQPAAGNGELFIWAAAVWAGGGISDLSATSLQQDTFSEGVAVAIEDADNHPILETKTRRQGPIWLSVPEGLYRVRFSHPRMRTRPMGATTLFMVAGLSIDAQDTIEVPVRAGRTAFAGMDALCAPPRDQPLEDLATCTVASVSDAGAR